MSAKELLKEEWTSAYLGDPALTWAMRIDPYMRSFSPLEKNKLINDLKFLRFEGPVKVHHPCVRIHLYCSDQHYWLQLRDPDIQMSVLLDYSAHRTTDGRAPIASTGLSDTAGQAVHDNPPVVTYLARLVASGGMREVTVCLIDKMDTRVNCVRAS